MKINRYRSSQRRSSQHGQTLIPIVIFIGLFLMAMLGVAADYTQVWAHRQMAQGAADAACEAGAADLYLNAVDPSSSGQNGLQSFSWIGTGFDCSSTNAGTPPADTRRERLFRFERSCELSQFPARSRTAPNIINNDSSLYGSDNHRSCSYVIHQDGWSRVNGKHQGKSRLWRYTH